MNNAELKEKMLKLFGAMREELDQMIEGLSDEEKKKYGSMAQWSAKDMLAHLAFWGSHFNEQVQKAQAGEHVPMEGDYYEILNDAVLIRNQEKHYDPARSEEQAAYDQTIRLLEAIDPDDLNDPNYLEFTNNRPLIDRALGTECWHVLSHLSDYYAGQGNLEKAEDLQVSFTEILKSFPGWKANAFYNLACFYSLHGMKEKAFKNLEAAFKERPELKDWAQKDPDIRPICQEVEFKTLVK